MATKKKPSKAPKSSEQQRGGTRPGAGRPAIGKPRTIILSNHSFAKAVRIGGGNASEGVRIALEAYGSPTEP